VGLLVSCPRKGRLHTIARVSFALRISALWHFRRKSPVCLPSTVHKAGSTTLGIPGPASNAPLLMGQDRSPAFDCQAALRSSDYRRFAGRAFASLCPLPHLDDRPAVTHAISRRPSHACRTCCCTHRIRDSKALPPTQDILVQVSLRCGTLRLRSRVRFGGTASPYQVIDVDSLAEDLARVVTGRFDRLMTCGKPIAAALTGNWPRG
jgi:hypothetical protein